MGTNLNAPFSQNAISQLLEERINFLARRQPNPKTQREIARDMGYEKPNIISMFKRGDAKVPLDKIPLLARSVEVDVGHMFRLAMEQYWPDFSQIVHEVFGNTVSANEMKLVRKFRELTLNLDPDPTEAQLQTLEATFPITPPAPEPVGETTS